MIKSMMVTSEIGCEANCFDDDDCMSVNFGPPEDSKNLCELSSSDHDIHPEGLIQQEGFTYKPVWVSVESFSFYSVYELFDSAKLPLVKLLSSRKIKQAFALYESNELDELARCCRKEVKKTKVRLIENHH